MKTLLLLVAAALPAIGEPLPVDGRVDVRASAVVVVGKRCGPCHMLRQEYDRSTSAAVPGHRWRRWVDRRYRVEFVEWQTLPPAEQNAVETLPAVIVDRPGGRRSAPVSFGVSSRDTAVASFGWTLYKEFPPHARR